MMNFFTGCVMSGKTKLLSNFLYLLRENEYLLIVPDLIYQDGNSQVKSRCEGYTGFSPNLRAAPSTNLFDYVKEKKDLNPNLRAVFIEEIQFFTKEHVDQLQRVSEELHIIVNGFGISKNHRDEVWEIVKYLTEKRNSNDKILWQVTEIAVDCYYCQKPATTNIRYDFNFSAQIDDCLNEDKQEKYLPCCIECHNEKRNLKL